MTVNHSIGDVMGRVHIAFKLSDDEHEELLKIGGDKSASLIAKQLVLDALIRNKETADQTLIMSIRTLSFVQRMAEAILPPDKLGEVFSKAIQDEKEMGKKVGAVGYE